MWEGNKLQYKRDHSKINTKKDKAIINPKQIDQTPKK